MLGVCEYVISNLPGWLEDCHHGACLPQRQAKAELHPDQRRSSQTEICTAGAQTTTESGGDRHRFIKPGSHTEQYLIYRRKHCFCLVFLLLSSLCLQIYALNKVMTELEQQQFEAFCKQMQSQGESWFPACSAFLFRLDQDLSVSENTPQHSFTDRTSWHSISWIYQKVL